jgi:hypothetical protein
MSAFVTKKRPASLASLTDTVSPLAFCTPIVPSFVGQRAADMRLREGRRGKQQTNKGRRVQSVRSEFEVSAFDFTPFGARQVCPLQRLECAQLWRPNLAV